MAPPQQTRDQSRARHAYEAVAAVLAKFPPTVTATAKGKKSTPHESAKKYGGQARKLPVRIVASGLGQALAFLKAKGYAPELLAALGDWVLGVARPAPDVEPHIRNKAADERLLAAVIFGSADFLRRATDEALAYLLWLNRFCEANNLTDETEA